jgi:RHS repeat-associated protein
MGYGNGKSLALSYDERLRLTQWNVAGVMGWNYRYHIFEENSQRVTYAQSLNDPTLNRSYDYDSVGRLWVSHMGNEADGHAGITGWPSGTPSGAYSQQYGYDQWGNITSRLGWGGENASYSATYTNNRRDGFSYDAAGNLTGDGTQSYQYDATGQQTFASLNALTQGYDGDRLRGMKTDGGVTTYYLRSSVLGGQVVAEIKNNGSSWYWDRGYVYLGSQLLAVQSNGVTWVHADPVTKSQRGTDMSGTVVSTVTVDVDPWGGETSRSSSAFQPHKFTSYERDRNHSDDAMMRRYSRWSRFDQPDPYDGSYDLTDPQSLNRYAYTGNDPVNFTDPTGLTTWCTTAKDGTVTCKTDGSYNGPIYMDGKLVTNSVQVYADPFWNLFRADFSAPWSIKTGIPDRAPEQKNPNACGDMARVAQGFANEALGATAGNPGAALSMFDQNFSRFYVGRSIGSTYTSAYELYRDRFRLHGTRDPYFAGSTGFKEMFRDSQFTRVNSSDQTHHFAAYLSAGINGQTAAAFGHMTGDALQLNRGDTSLGDRAYQIGANLRSNPSRLRSIGSTISRVICN